MEENYFPAVYYGDFSCVVSLASHRGLKLVFYVIELTLERCLVIRFCLEMAYCGAQQDGRVNLATATLESLREFPIGFLAHKDLSRSNIAVGGLLPELQHPEHDMNPILKLLDFGTAAVMDPSE